MDCEASDLLLPARARNGALGPKRGDREGASRHCKVLFVTGGLVLAERGCEVLAVSNMYGAIVSETEGDCQSTNW